jgi:hypothetical protein
MRISAEDKKALEDAASRSPHDENLSMWLRRVALQAAGVRPPVK